MAFTTIVRERSQTWNRYAYVNNNPLSFVDPLGLLPIPACTYNGSCPSGGGSSGCTPNDTTACVTAGLPAEANAISLLNDFLFSLLIGPGTSSGDDGVAGGAAGRGSKSCGGVPLAPCNEAKLTKLITQLQTCPQYSQVGNELAQMASDGSITTDPNQNAYGWYHPWSDTMTLSPDAMQNDSLTPIHELGHRHQTMHVGGSFWGPVGALGMLVGAAEGGVSKLWDRFVADHPLSEGFVENLAQAYAEKVAGTCGIK